VIRLDRLASQGSTLHAEPRYGPVQEPTLMPTARAPRKSSARKSSARVKHYREWLSEHPREPKARMALAVAAVDAYERCERKKRIADDELAPLVAAAESPHALVFNTGCDLLVGLAAKSSDAQRGLLELAGSTSATARFHAIAFVDRRLPKELRLEIVRAALSDTSPKIRAKGVERAEELALTALLPRLEELRRDERHASVRSALDLHLPILRDGHCFEPRSDGSGQLTVRCDDGSLLSVTVGSSAAIRQRAARLRADPYAD
jgi:hypothetical protein